MTPASIETAETAKFDYSAAMTRLCEDICLRVPALRHIEMKQVAVTFAQTRSRVAHGMQAKLTPLRFENGGTETIIDARRYGIRRMFRGNIEILYLLTFYLPRFQQHSFREKLVTIFHELFHISPTFDGDIRRFEGRCYMHTASEKEYDAEMEQHVKTYLATDPDGELLDFLRVRFETLTRRFGRVVGTQIPIPKLIELPDPSPAED